MANSKRRCKQCGVYTRDFIRHPIGKFCNNNDECVHGFIRASQEAVRARNLKKARIDANNQIKSNRKAAREFNRQDLTRQHKLTKIAFNRMRVLQELEWFAKRGQEAACISCGKPLGGDQWCCGHFKTVGAQGGLRYDRMNTYLQHNQYCNMRLSGDISGTKTTRGYIQGLLDRFGEKGGQAIIDYCDTHTEVVKWEWQDLESFRKECNQMIRELERKI